MKKKFYAVKVGKKPGIYKTWDECKKQIEGFSGASYKGFVTLEEANAFLAPKIQLGKSAEQKKSFIEPSEATAYVDGSYDDSQKEFSYGLVLFVTNEEKHFAEKFDTKELVSMRNVAGEIKGAQIAMQYCLANGIYSLDLFYDYEGIEKWCSGEWKANKSGTKEYKAFYDDIKQHLNVRFYKVTAHSGNTYNDLADKLAKEALQGVIKALPKGIFDVSKKINIFVDKSDLIAFLQEMGTNEWESAFIGGELKNVGNQQRYNFEVNSAKESIDIYSKADGTATIKATKPSFVYAPKFIDQIEKNSFTNKHQNSNCTFNAISDEIYKNLLTYLQSRDKINEIEKKEIASPKHEHSKYKSSFGDSLVIKYFANGTLLFQGNPAYILTEAMYFMSIQGEVREESILKIQSEIYCYTEISVDKSREKLKNKIPNAYEKLNDDILKILSPSIILSESNICVEEYSCLVFPALKALEAVLLDRLANKNIMVSSNQNFGSFFELDPNTSKHILKQRYKHDISNNDYCDYLDEVYNYFKNMRHTLFHANQITSMTKMIFNKFEADSILSKILILIDKSGIKTF